MLTTFPQCIILCWLSRMSQSYNQNLTRYVRKSQKYCITGMLSTWPIDLIWVIKQMVWFKLNHKNFIWLHLWTHTSRYTAPWDPSKMLWNGFCSCPWPHQLKLRAALDVFLEVHDRFKTRSMPSVSRSQIQSMLSERCCQRGIQPKGSWDGSHSLMTVTVWLCLQMTS